MAKKGRPKSDESRTIVISVRLSELEYQFVKERADSLSLTPMKLTRGLLKLYAVLPPQAWDSILAPQLAIVKTLMEDEDKQLRSKQIMKRGYHFTRDGAKIKDEYQIQSHSIQEIVDFLNRDRHMD